MSALPNVWRTSCTPLLVLLLLSVQRGFCALTDTEKDFIEVPSPDSARESLQFITSKPHVAGTPGDHEMAQYVHDRFTSAGVPHVEIQPVDVLLSNPISSSLQLIDTTVSASDSAAVVFTATLSEDVLDLDTTSDTWYRNHTYNGYSPSGDVTAPLVYANYGRPEDFDALEAAGVSVDGTIVITRYGECFRGLKAMNAQMRGALGTIIYSDPEQDGSKKGPTYPDGGYRPSSSVQRGSAVFTSLCAGDPARAASAKPVEEICGFSQEELIPAIPVMPISYGDAEPLLRALEGAPAPEGFQGGLDFSYTVGPSGSAAAVRLVVENEAHVGPVWNVIGTIPGTLPEDEDQAIVIGNHRDAWVFGAVDPNSGTAALIEVARGLGVLFKGGWRPLRTIVLCSWSGEELGMLGSTAWGEENAEGVLAKAAAYLNVDSAVSGKLLRVKATPSLSGLVSGALGDVEDPASGKTLLEAWSGDLQMLGSGSDYAVFLDHLGIATVDFEFQEDAEAEYGVYHSIYDSFSWVETYGDPGFRYFQAAARFWGLMTLRLATSDILPFDPTIQAAALEEYVTALSPAAAAAGENESAESVRTAATASLLSEIDLAPLREAVAAFRAAADAVRSWVDASANMKTIPVSQAAAARAVLLRGAERFQGRRPPGGPGSDGVSRSGGGSGNGDVEVSEGASETEGLTDGGSVKDLNERLSMTERRFLSEEGLPGRQWFRHVLQAPGLYLGYAAESFPGITQALRDGDEALAQAQVAVASGCINDAADFLSGGSVGPGAPRQGASERDAATRAAEP